MVGRALTERLKMLGKGSSAGKTKQSQEGRKA